MKNWKQLLSLVLAGAMALSLFACGAVGADPSSSVNADYSDSESSPPDSSPDPEASASPEIVADLSQGVLEFSAGVSPTDVMVTVNGVGIPADLFLYMLSMNCMNMTNYLPYFGMSLGDVAETLLDESTTMAVYHTLIRQKAAELGCLPTDAQNEELRTAMDEADLEASVPYWGLTESSAEFIFAMNIYYDNVMQAVTHAPSAEELDQYVADRGVFAVKHILLKTTDDSNQPLADDVIAEKKSQAEDLLAQLQSAEDLTAKFDELMNEYSEDGGLASNPDGYVFDADSSLVGGFREATLELEPGQISGVVETDYGYHIMLRLPLAEDALGQYRDSFRTSAMEDILAQWMDESDITRADALSSLDVASFYDRLVAYQNALAERDGQD